MADWVQNKKNDERKEMQPDPPNLREKKPCPLRKKKRNSKKVEIYTLQTPHENIFFSG